MTYVVDAAAAVVQRARGRTGHPRRGQRRRAARHRRRLYATLVALYGGDPDDLDWRGERSRYQFVSAERLRTVLGLETLTSLEDGLSAIIDWHRTELRAAPQTADAGPA